MKMLLEPVVLAQMARTTHLGAAAKETFLKLCLNPKATIAANTKTFGMKYDTLRRHIRELEKADWAYEILEPRTNRLLVVPSMPLHVEQLLAKHWQTLRNYVAWFGEWLTGRWFSAIVDDLAWLPNARPESLVSGDGGHRMEIDFLFEKQGVAAEFQGNVHFEAGPSPEDQEKLRKQQERDATKALLCARKDLIFVEITGNDLRYETLVNKFAHLLPLIPPRKDRPVYRLLADLSHSYVNYLRR